MPLTHSWKINQTKRKWKIDIWPLAHINYLEMARNRDGSEDLDNIKLLILIPIDQINRCSSWNPHDISLFHVEVLSLLLPNCCDC